MSTKQFLIIPSIVASIYAHAQTDSVLSKKFWSIGIRTLHPNDFTESGVLFTPEVGYNFKQHEIIGGVIIRTFLFSPPKGINSPPFTGGILTYRYFLFKRLNLLEPHVSYEILYNHSWYGVVMKFSSIAFESKWIDTHVENFLLFGTNININKRWHLTLATGYGMSTYTIQWTSNGKEVFGNKETKLVYQIKVGVEYNLLDVYRNPKKSLH